MHHASRIQCPASCIQSVTAKVLKILSPDFREIFVIGMCA